MSQASHTSAMKASTSAVAASYGVDLSRRRRGYSAVNRSPCMRAARRAARRGLARCSGRRGLVIEQYARFWSVCGHAAYWGEAAEADGNDHGAGPLMTRLGFRRSSPGLIGGRCSTRQSLRSGDTETLLAPPRPSCTRPLRILSEPLKPRTTTTVRSPCRLRRCGRPGMASLLDKIFSAWSTSTGTKR
jgi:hypothetical protein